MWEGYWYGRAVLKEILLQEPNVPWSNNFQSKLYASVSSSPQLLPLEGKEQNSISAGKNCFFISTNAPERARSLAYRQGWHFLAVCHMSYISEGNCLELPEMQTYDTMLCKLPKRCSSSGSISPNTHGSTAVWSTDRSTTLQGHDV